MRSGSQKARESARDRWEGFLREIPGQEVEASQAIFAVLDVFKAQPALVNAVEDSARTGEDRARLVSELFHGKVRDDVVELVAGLARERWSEDGDIMRSMEYLGAFTLLVGARRENQLSQVEEELYVTMRVLRHERGLRLTLSDLTYPAVDRAQLIEKVFDKYCVYTQKLLGRAVMRIRRDRTLVHSLTRYLDLAGEVNQHIVASVTSAVPLTREQEDRLRALLTRKYEKDVAIHVTLNPAVIGGIRIHVAEDVIDGTLASRIASLQDTFIK